jgi:hypothetical protein
VPSGEELTLVAEREGIGMGIARRGAPAAALALACANAVANDFTISPVLVTSTFKWSVSIDGDFAVNNRTLTVLTGQTYLFHLSGVTSHPFYIDQTTGIGGTNAYPVGSELSANGVTSNGTVTMNLGANAPDTLYYACGIHTTMIGQITVVHDLLMRDNFEL